MSVDGNDMNAQDNLVDSQRSDKQVDHHSQSSNQQMMHLNNMDFLNDVQIVLTIEVGRAQIKIRDLLNLSKDSIIDLNKSAGEPVDIYANGKLISRGNIITANGKYCVRLTSIAQSVSDSTTPQ